MLEKRPINMKWVESRGGMNNALLSLCFTMLQEPKTSVVFPGDTINSKADRGRLYTSEAEIQQRERRRKITVFLDENMSIEKREKGKI